MRRNSQAGSALIEFAGSLILLSSLFTGIFQVGYTFFSYERLENSVRAAARYASLHAAGSANVPDEALVQTVRNLAVYDDPTPAAGAKPLVTGLATANIDVLVTGKTATVSVRGFTLDSLFSKVKLDGRPTVTFPITRGEAQ